MNRLRSAGGRLPALLALIISAILLVTACSGDQPTPPTESERQQTAVADQTDQPEQPQQPASESRPSDSQQPQDDASQPESQAQAQQSQDTGTQRSQPQAQQPQSQQSQPALEDQALPALAAQPILGGRQFEQPIEMLTLPDGSFLVAEQRGSITRYVEEDDEVRQFGVLDLTEQVVFAGERGLLSMAVDPRFPEAPYLYVYYSPRESNVSRLSRFELRDGSALPGSELIVIEVDQPYANHNGGAVRFGSDGMLYLGLGDGGAANDPHGHGQNTETLLGSIIRIDVRESTASRPYRIPTDNPFLGRAGFRPEIWAFGLRNPWRMAFDQETGELWVGDVGQDRFEEIAVVRAGDNHGWNVFEGAFCFASEQACAELTGAIPPVAVYPHPQGCSVTGGVVYRGSAMPALNGRYIFGDYCAGAIWSIEDGEVIETGLELGALIASFAVDREGEIYVLAFNGPILKLIPDSR